MTTMPKPSLEEIQAFARRYGLDNLAPEHLARMTELPFTWVSSDARCRAPLAKKMRRRRSSKFPHGDGLHS